MGSLFFGVDLEPIALCLHFKKKESNYERVTDKNVTDKNVTNRALHFFKNNNYK